MTVIVVFVCTAAALIAVLLVVVAAGIRREPQASELSATAPGLTATIVRRALGVSVRKPHTGERGQDMC